VAAPAVPAFTGDEQRALGWYARTMSGAPVQDEDLETVAALARPVVHAVRLAASRELDWTDTQQALAPLMQAARARREEK
ncbi:MAG: hypothetical protein ACRYGL_10915, partial [Janthinobacterium lividum]